jgi:enoyl-CoA hydratase/carnithine racemase
MSLNANIRRRFADYVPQHFNFSLADKVATVTLNRPERKNPLTFN